MLIAFHAVPSVPKAHVDATSRYYVLGCNWPPETPVEVVALRGGGDHGVWRVQERASCPLSCSSSFSDQTEVHHLSHLKQKTNRRDSWVGG